MFIFAVALLIQFVTVAATPEPVVDAPAFDEAAQKARYATFIIRWYDALDFDEKNALDGQKPKARWRSPTPLATPAAVSRWPIGVRGIFGNAFNARTRLRWVGAKLSALPDKVPEPLGELFALWANCYEPSAEPKECVPGACYFVPRCEYQRSGYWLALRDAEAGPELVGVLIWKENRENPAKDPQLGKWLKGVEAGLAAPP